MNYLNHNCQDAFSQTLHTEKVEYARAVSHLHVRQHAMTHLLLRIARIQVQMLESCLDEVRYMEGVVHKSMLY